MVIMILIVILRFNLIYLFFSSSSLKFTVVNDILVSAKIGAIISHICINYIDISIGIDKHEYEKPYRIDTIFVFFFSYFFLKIKSITSLPF